jgi:DNA-binding LacI/PurR family transcriptional regulator
MMLRKGVSGAVVRTTLATRSTVDALSAEGFPMVVVADRFENPAINYVYSDSVGASREAVEHLIGQGHTRIAICLNTIDDSDHLDRLAGYQQAMEANKIPIDERRILRAPANREGGIQLLRRVMTQPDRPTALFLADPMTAVGLLGEARRLNIRIPEELSIVGFDDADLRYMVCPELTAVCQDAAALGRDAFLALHGLIDGDRKPVRKALATWLEIHASAGPVSQ